MFTSLSFNLFGNVLHRKQTNLRRISGSQIIYDGALCDNESYFVLTKQLQLRWWRNRRAASVCIFSFHDKIGIMEEDKDQENSSISYIGTFFLFSVQGIQFLLPLLTNSCSLIDPFVFWGFYKVLFESIPLFWKYSNNL